MISPSSERAVISSSAGRLSSRRAGNGFGIPAVGALPHSSWTAYLQKRGKIFPFFPIFFSLLRLKMREKLL